MNAASSRRTAAPRPKSLGVLAWVSLGGCALLLALVAAVLFLRTKARPALTGPTLSGSPAAANFSLPDQHGQAISMSALRGKVVAMTFLYTRCPDVCPAIASKLGAADARLGSQASKIQMLAVTIDPLGDTPARIAQFDSEHGLAQASNWHYLTGSPARLTPVWHSYGVGSNASLSGALTSPEQLEHSAMVYLIDRQGRLRVALPANFTQSDFLQDVRALS